MRRFITLEAWGIINFSPITFQSDKLINLSPNMQGWGGREGTQIIIINSLESIWCFKCSVCLYFSFIQYTLTINKQLWVLVILGTTKIKLHAIELNTLHVPHWKSRLAVTSIYSSKFLLQPPGFLHNGGHQNHHDLVLF